MQAITSYSGEVVMGGWGAMTKAVGEATAAGDPGGSRRTWQAQARGVGGELRMTPA